MSITVPQWNKKDKLGRGGYEKFKNWIKDKVLTKVLTKVNCNGVFIILTPIDLHLILLNIELEKSSQEKSN